MERPDAAEGIIRAASGVDELARLAREAGLSCVRDVSVDALHDGKPVCPLTVPAVVEGRAVFVAESGLPPSVARARRDSLVAAVPMPVRFIPASLS